MCFNPVKVEDPPYLHVHVYDSALSPAPEDSVPWQGRRSRKEVEGPTRKLTQTVSPENNKALKYNVGGIHTGRTDRLSLPSLLACPPCSSLCPSFPRAEPPYQ